MQNLTVFNPPVYAAAEMTPCTCKNILLLEMTSETWDSDGFETTLTLAVVSVEMSYQHSPSEAVWII